MSDHEHDHDHDHALGNPDLASTERKEADDLLRVIYLE